MEDTNLTPVNMSNPLDLKNIGLDWDIRAAQPNVDIPFFAAITTCIEKQFSISSRNVFLAGFSAGATFANLLHSTFPDRFAAIATASGLWANDQKNREIAAEITFGLVKWEWPPLKREQPTGKTAILYLHGGKDDVLPIPEINFPGFTLPLPNPSLENAAQAAMSTLTNNGRLVIDCPHKSGHTMTFGGPEYLPFGGGILSFFHAHLNTQISPFQNNPLQGLPWSCKKR